MSKFSNTFFRNSGGSKCVRTTEGEQMAQRIGAVAYVENSALTKEGVRNVSFRLLCPSKCTKFFRYLKLRLAHH